MVLRKDFSVYNSGVLADGINRLDFWPSLQLWNVEMKSRDLLVIRTASWIAMFPLLYCFIANAEERPTYADIAPIFAASCWNCHRAGGDAPMALESYEQVRPWSKRIRELVLARRMPPFGADGPEGFFVNDARLSDEEVERILAWIDQGASKGPPIDAIAPPKVDPPAWEQVRPDFVATTLVPDVIDGRDEDDWAFVFFDYVASHELWLRGVRVLPERPGVIHHANVFTIDPEYELPPEEKIFGNAHLEQSHLLSLWAPGRPPLWCPEGAAIRIPAGTRFGANIHYAPTQRSQRHRARLALYFADGRIHHELSTIVTSLSPESLAIPAGSRGVEIRGGHRFTDEDVLVYAFAGHMHFRGTSIAVDLIGADGSARESFRIPRFDPMWQQQYYLSNPVTIPAGSTASIVATFDNSDLNPYNPDPQASVRGGYGTNDEMAQMYFEVISPARRLNLVIQHGKLASSEPIQSDRTR